MLPSEPRPFRPVAVPQAAPAVQHLWLLGRGDKPARMIARKAWRFMN
jgi:hypothetical protein